MTEEENLLAEFPAVSTAEWEAAIASDLKGASYEEELIWHMPEGIAVRPYYRAEDLAELDWAETAPGTFPYLRGARIEGGWAIREFILTTNPASANREALSMITAGTEEIAFSGESIADKYSPAVLLADLDGVPVHIASVNGRQFRPLFNFLKKNPRFARVSTGFDPLEDVEIAREAVDAELPGFVPFTIDGTKLTADADAIMQIGRTLAAGIKYLDAMQDHGANAASAASAVEFSFAIGPNYFFEIASLRAFRMIWARVLEIYGVSSEAARARIAAYTSYPPADADNGHWNVLRATTEAISAILGGADSICIAAFGEGETLTRESGRRLARNTQLLLKHEAFISRVADPGGGSYYLEALTNSIADAAWKLMQETENCRGLRPSSTSNKVREVSMKGTES
jgi:methylmalonyl-CoA mutase